MKTSGLLRQRDTSGSKAAALVGAGIGLCTFFFSGDIIGAFQPLQDLLANLGVNTQNLPVSEATVGTTGWLGSWLVLHQKWKRKRKRIRTLLIIGAILLLIVLYATIFHTDTFNIPFFTTNLIHQ